MKHKAQYLFIPKEHTLIVHHGEEYNVRTTSHETILDLAFNFENMINSTEKAKQFTINFAFFVD